MVTAKWPLGLVNIFKQRCKHRNFKFQITYANLSWTPAADSIQELSGRLQGDWQAVFQSAFHLSPLHKAG